MSASTLDISLGEIPVFRNRLSRVASSVSSDQRLSSRGMHGRIRNDRLAASTPQFSRPRDARQCVVVGLGAAIGGYGIAPWPCVVSRFRLPCISSLSRATLIITWDAPTAISLTSRLRSASECCLQSAAAFAAFAVCADRCDAYASKSETVGLPASVRIAPRTKDNNASWRDPRRSGDEPWCPAITYPS